MSSLNCFQQSRSSRLFSLPKMAQVTQQDCLQQWLIQAEVTSSIHPFDPSWHWTWNPYNLSQMAWGGLLGNNVLIFTVWFCHHPAAQCNCESHHMREFPHVGHHWWAAKLEVFSIARSWAFCSSMFWTMQVQNLWPSSWGSRKEVQPISLRGGRYWWVSLAGSG